MASFVAMGLVLPFVYRPMPAEHLAIIAMIAVLAFVAGLLVIAAYRRGDAAVRGHQCNIPRSSWQRATAFLFLR